MSNDSVTRHIGAENVVLHYLATLNKLTRPTGLIGRLAVDQAFQGEGLGSVLLADACLKVKQASDSLAVVGIVVDAKDDSTAAFYRHFGFIALPGKSDRFLLPNAAFC